MIPHSSVRAGARGPAFPRLFEVQLAGVAACTLACASAPRPDLRLSEPTSLPAVSSSAATPLDASGEATRALVTRLRSTLARLAASESFALGHEDGTAYGVGWSEDADRSDVKSVCGSHPAVYGWDVFRIENADSQNGDGVNFDLMRQRIQEAHRRGGINTLSWHVDNPVIRGDAWDTTPAVAAIVPGGTHHAVYRSYLDRVADFLESCRADDGALIPIIFRPFHEHTGSWFWWGKDHTTDADYISLWRFSIDYLRNERGFEHLLFAFSPGGADLKTSRDYLFRYPGDAYVDVMGVDHYYDTDVASLLRAVGTTVAVAAAHHKIAALTEFGIKDGLSELTPPNWFSKNFFEPLIASPSTSRIAYALAWRNAGVDHCFVPYPGHPTAADFRRICDDPRLVLERDLSLEKAGQTQ